MYDRFFLFFFSSRRRHTRWPRDWSSDVCSSDLILEREAVDTEIDIEAMGLVARATKAREVAVQDMTPGERLFYERYTLCHVAREPSDHTFRQWQGRSEERRVGKEGRGWLATERL